MKIKAVFVSLPRRGMEVKPVFSVPTETAAEKEARKTAVNLKKAPDQKLCPHHQASKSIIVRGALKFHLFHSLDERNCSVLSIIGASHNEVRVMIRRSGQKLQLFMSGRSSSTRRFMRSRWAVSPRSPLI